MTLLLSWCAAHDIAAEQPQRYLWRGLTRATVSNYAAASTFFATAAKATVRGRSVGEHVRGGGRAWAGVTLWIYVSEWWRSTAWR